MSTATPVAPATPTANGQGTLSELVSGIVSDAQHLLKQQVEMVRAEFKEDLRRTLFVVQCFAIGAGLSAVGGVLLIVAAVHLLAYLAPALPTWACWAIVGGSAVAAGLVAVLLGARKLASYNPLPDKSLNALQESVSWIANRQS